MQWLGSPTSVVVVAECRCSTPCQGTEQQKWRPQVCHSQKSLYREWSFHPSWGLLIKGVYKPLLGGWVYPLYRNNLFVSSRWHFVDRELSATSALYSPLYSCRYFCWYQSSNLGDRDHSCAVQLCHFGESKWHPWVHHSSSINNSLSLKVYFQKLGVPKIHFSRSLSFLLYKMTHVWWKMPRILRY